MSLPDILDRLRQLREDGSPPDAFAPYVHRLLAVGPRSLASRHKAGVTVYRATSHHQSIPTTIHELWYPPAHVALLARANSKGHPIFYASPDPNCVLHELGIKTGQFLVHAQWRTTEEMILYEIGYTDRAFARAKTSRPLPERHRAFYTSAIDDPGRTVRDFLALAFVDDTSRSYALTAAITEVLLKTEWLSGIMYPAVAKAARADNVALRPEFVQRGMRFSEATIVRVTRVESPGSVEAVRVATLSGVDASGGLSWQFTNEKSAPADSALQVPTNAQILAVSPALLAIGNTQYKIEPGYLIGIDGDRVAVSDLRGVPVSPSTDPNS